MDIVLQILGLAAVVLVAGFTVEWVRRRGLRAWAESMGGSFEAGGILAGVPLPEAAAFDSPGGDTKPVYNNVVRVRRGERAFVLARYYRSRTDVRGQVRSVSDPVCFLEIPGLDAPPVRVGPSLAFPAALRQAVGMAAPPDALRFAHAVKRDYAGLLASAWARAR